MSSLRQPYLQHPKQPLSALASLLLPLPYFLLPAPANPDPHEPPPPASFADTASPAAHTFPRPPRHRAGRSDKSEPQPAAPPLAANSPDTASAKIHIAHGRLHAFSILQT